MRDVVAIWLQQGSPIDLFAKIHADAVGEAVDGPGKDNASDSDSKSHDDEERRSGEENAFVGIPAQN